MDELSEADKLTVERARKIQCFPSQPFAVAQVFTGIKGGLVNLKDTIPLFVVERDDLRDRSAISCDRNLTGGAACSCEWNGLLFLSGGVNVRRLHDLVHAFRTQCTLDEITDSNSSYKGRESRIPALLLCHIVRKDLGGVVWLRMGYKASLPANSGSTHVIVKLNMEVKEKRGLSSDVGLPVVIHINIIIGINIYTNIFTHIGTYWSNMNMNTSTDITTNIICMIISHVSTNIFT
jgi:hypothetical protein